MRTGAEWKPVNRGRVIGLGLGKYVWAGAGVALMLAASTAWAGPENPRVVRGQAEFRQRGNRTVIRVSDRAIINYSGFDIARGETVRFIQPNSNSRVLNRIESARPTQIDGTLRANGHVYLVNPVGVLFSGSAVIDVAHLYAAAGNISNRDFNVGIDRFTGVNGDVVNQGTIYADSAALIGRHVQNTGVIISQDPDGMIAMASGEDVTLTPRGGTMSVTIANPTAQVIDDGRAGIENSGRVQARDGRTLMVAGDLYSLAIKNSGTVKSKDITIDGGSGRVEVGGTLSAADRTVGGRGGSVTVTGGHIAVSDAMIDASGSRSGGTVRIGGDVRGGGTLAQSDMTTVDQDSQIKADAARRGGGGTVVVYSAGHTAFHGTASAQGGDRGGDGGFVETSGKQTLNIADARVRAGGKAGEGHDGANGQWLLDPTDMVIDGAAATSIVASLDSGTDVTVETGSTGGDAGNITVDAAINKTAGGDATLTLRAANDLVVNQAISSSSGQLNTNLLANNGEGGNTDPDSTMGSVILNNDGVTTFGGVASNGGAIVVEGVDVQINGSATLDAGSAGGNGTVAFAANSSADQTLGIAGGAGAFDLSVAELTTGVVNAESISVTTTSRDDAASIGALDLSGQNTTFIVRAGSVTADALTVAAGRNINLRADAGSVTLNGAVSASGGAVLVRGDDLAADGPSSSITADVVTITANGDRTIGFGGPGDMGISVAEIANITSATLSVRSAGAGDITVGNSGDPSMPLAPTAADVTIATAGKIDEVAVDDNVDIQVTGVLTLESGTGIGDAGTNDGTGQGPLDISAGSLVASVSGTGGAFIKDNGGLSDAQITIADGAVSLRSTGDLTIDTVDANQDTPTGRSVELVANGNLTVTGGVSSNGLAYMQSTAAGGDIDAVGVAAARTSVNTTGAGGDATIAADGALELAASNVGGALTVTATGAVTDSGTLTVGGALSVRTLNDAGADITLDEVNNSFGAITAQARDMADGADAAGDITIVERSIPGNTRMDVALISTTGDVTLTAPDVGIDTGSPGEAITAANITLQPNTPATTVGIDGAGDFNVSLAELQELAATGQVTIGGTDSGAVTIGSVGDLDLTAQGYDLRVRGGNTLFLRSVTLADDRLFTAQTGSISTATGAADVTIGGSSGRVLLDTTGAVDIEIDAARLAARTSAGAIDVENLGTGLEIVSIGAVDGIQGASNADVTVETGGVLTVSESIVGNGTGTVTLTAADGIHDSVGTGDAVAAAEIVLNAMAGAIAGPGGAGTFKTDTTNLTASAPDGIDIDNSAGGVLQATMTADSGAVVLESGGSISTAGTDWTADSFDIRAGGSSGVFTATDAVVSDAGDIRITAHDISLTAAGAALNAGMDDVIIARSSEGTIGIGDIATEDLTISNAELAKITAANLIVGDATSTTKITVEDVNGSDSENIGTVRLVAERDNATIVFTGSQSVFNALNARADAGIEVDSDITADSGDLALNADADAMLDDDAAGMNPDQIVIRPGRTITTQPGGGNIELTGASHDMGMTTGIVAEGNLTLNSNQDIAINSSITVDGTLTLDAEGSVTLGGSGEGQVLNVSANNGISFGGNVTNQSGDLTIDADADDDGTGTFAIAADRTLDTSDGDLLVIAGDLDLAGSIDAGEGNVTLRRSTTGEFAIGNFTDLGGRTTISGEELGRITAMDLTIGGGDATAIMVDGVTSDQTANIAGTVILDAGTTATFSGDDSAFGRLRVSADEDITIASGLTTAGELTLNADVDSNDSGVLTISGDIDTGDGPFTASAADLVLSGMLNAGTGAVRIGRSAEGNITVDNAPDVAGRMTIDDAELQLITAGELTIGGGATRAITVRNFSETDGAGISGVTTFDAATVLTFGGSSTFKSLVGQADDRIAVNGDLTTTEGDLILDGNANAANDADDKIEIVSGRTFEAARDLVLSAERGGIEGSGSLTLRAGRAVTLSDSLTTSGDTVIAADFDGDGTGVFTLEAGNTLTTTGSNLEITASDLVLDGSVVAGAGSVSIDRSSVGGINLGGTGTPADRMIVSGAELGRITATGLTLGGVNTDSLIVSGISDGNSNFIAGTTTLSALADGGSVTFSGLASRFNTLSVRADRLITTSVGLNTDSGSITMDAGANTATRDDGIISLGGNLTASGGLQSFFDISLNSPVRLRSNVAVEGEDITFASRVNSSASNLRSLTVNSHQNGTTTFRGTVGGDNRLSGLFTNSDGVTRLAADIFTTGDGMAFNDRVVLLDDVTLRDFGAGMTLAGAVNSDSNSTPRSLTLLTRSNTSDTVDRVPVIVLLGPVGTTNRLNSLNLNFDPSRGIDGRANVPRVATIVTRPVGTNGQFNTVTGTLQTFRFEARNFRMGQNEKMTVGGNLEIVATNQARLGDLVSLGNMTVTSPDIRLVTRQPGTLSARDPNQTTGTGVRVNDRDRGLDFVAGGRFNFSSRPVAIGDGPAPSFGSATGERDVGNQLSGFIFQTYQGFFNALIDVGNPIITQDLKSSGPSDTNFADALAGAIPRESRQNDVSDENTISSARFEDLEQLGVFPRDLTDEERIAGLIGWSTYDDFPETSEPSDSDFRTAVTRLPGERTAMILEMHQRLFYRTVTDPQTGETRIESRAPEIKQAFEESIKRFRDERPGAVDRVDPVSLREYVERVPEEAESRAYARQLGELLEQLELLGLSNRELRKSKAAVLRLVRPTGLPTREQFEIFLKTDIRALEMQSAADGLEPSEG